MSIFLETKEQIIAKLKEDLENSEANRVELAGTIIKAGELDNDDLAIKTGVLLKVAAEKSRYIEILLALIK